jgi:adenylate cyclase
MASKSSSASKTVEAKTAGSSKGPAAKGVRITGFSLRTKFTGMTVFIISVLMALVLWFVYNQESDALGRVVRERGATIARNLATNSSEFFLPNLDELTLQMLVKESMQEEGANQADSAALGVWDQIIKDLTTPPTKAVKNLGVVEAVIADKSGTIVAHSDYTKAHINYEKLVYIQKADEQSPYPTYLFKGRPTYDISFPVVMKGAGQELGVVHIGLRRDIIDRRVRVAATKVTAVIGGMLLVGVIFTIFLVGTLLRPVGPLVRGVQAVAQGDFSQNIRIRRRDELGDLIEAYNGMAKSLGENETLKEAFSHYTSSDLMAEVLSDPSKAAKLGGERREATVLFTLLHGVHELSETMDPMEFVELLNEYLTAQTEIIPKHKGHIDKYVREEVMAVWGVPAANPEHAFQGVSAAVEIQANLKKLNQARDKKGKATLGVSIGLNTGDLISGNMGSQQKFDYTVIGDTVNTAARLMANGKVGQVLIPVATYELVKDRFLCEALDPIRVKGKKEPLKIFNVKSAKD